MKICFDISIEATFFGPFLFLHTTEEGTVEDKKFITPKRFIREKFRLQKVGVTEVFLWVKVVSDFDFGHFLKKWSQRHLDRNIEEKNFHVGIISSSS